MYCPQCSFPLIETESKEELSSSYSIPYGTLVGTSSVGSLVFGSGGGGSGSSGQYLTNQGTGWVPTSPPLQKVFNCPKCHISIKIDDDKKSKEKKELMRIIEGLMEQKKKCDDIVEAFNNRWDDNQSVERLEALLILK